MSAELGFRTACAGAAEMLAKIAHLDGFPAGGDALASLSLSVDGKARRLTFSWGADGEAGVRPRAAALPPDGIQHAEAPVVPPGPPISSARAAEREEARAALARLAAAAEPTDRPEDDTIRAIGCADAGPVDDEQAELPSPSAPAPPGAGGVEPPPAPHDQAPAAGRVAKARRSLVAPPAELPPMIEGETRGAAASRLRKLGRGWSAIAAATGLGTAGAAANAARRHDFEHAPKTVAVPAVSGSAEGGPRADRPEPALSAEPEQDAAPAPAPDVTSRAATQDDGQGAAAGRPAAPAAPPPEPSPSASALAPIILPSADPDAPDVRPPPSHFLVVVKHGGREWAAGRTGVIPVSTEAAAALRKLANGYMYGADVLARAMGQREVASAALTLSGLKARLLPIGVKLSGTPAGWVARLSDDAGGV